MTEIKSKANIVISTVFFLLTFFIFKEVEIMRDMYVALVTAQRRTCNPENKKVPLVPVKYRQIVIEDLAAVGLDPDGNMIQ